MKLTVFTSNQSRHQHLINSLSKICDECFVVVEGSTVFPGRAEGFYQRTPLMQSYFQNVLGAEQHIFGDLSFLGDNVRSLYLKLGDLNLLRRDILEPALESDVYVVFGSSFIKGWLIDFLVEQHAINIHMGVSPYYRGSSCNFWALYDGNPHYVGATIHMLSKGLDSGDILYHALPDTSGCSSIFDYSMKAVKVAHQSLAARISDRSIFDLPKVTQNRAEEVRYSRNAEFTDDIVEEYLARDVSLEQIADLRAEQFRKELYVNPIVG